MLTDRQLLAMTFLANTISNEADLVFLAKNPGKIIDYALTCADKFLEKTKSPDKNLIPLIEIENQLQVTNHKLETIIKELDVQYLESTSGN
ncbi:MAG TPA: hypothetical protein V6D21_03105 [Candidatus Obscuribacterales bacterium]